MWYLAANYESSATAKSIWQSIYTNISDLNINLTPVNILLSGRPTVVCIADDAPGLSIQNLLRGIMNTRGGSFVTLDQSVTQSLLARRHERMSHARGKQDKPGFSYEGHTLTPVSYNSSEPMEIEELRRHMNAIQDTVNGMGLPFIEVYKLYLKYRLDATDKWRNDRFIEAFDSLTFARIDASAKYLFTDSGRAMHDAVSTGDYSLNNPVPHLWLEHDNPQPVPGQPGRFVKAFFLYAMYDETLIRLIPVSDLLKDRVRDTLKGKYTGAYGILVLDDLTQSIINMLYDPHSKDFSVAPQDHICPYGKCQERTVTANSGYLIGEEATIIDPCEGCIADMHMWLAWIHTACDQIQLKYAVRPEKTPFPMVEQTYQEKKKVPRHHGKGPDKEKVFTHSVPYTLVTYDVSIAADREKHAPAVAPAAPGENWLTLHGKEDIIYQRHTIAEYKRTLQGSHYQNLIQQCLQGGTVRRDGVEYTVEFQGDRPAVIATTKEHGKYVPMLRSDVRKKQIVKKVVATGYQEGK
jgi:hypothetical protein